MESSKQAARKIKDAVAGKAKDTTAQPEQRISVTLGREPQLNHYILNRALRRPEGLSFTDLVRALLDVKDRAGEKSARSQLGSIILHLSFYEEFPPDVISILLPLYQAYAKEPRSLRSLLYLGNVYAGPGTAGTPTLIDPSLSGRRPDPRAIAALVGQARLLIEQPKVDPAIRRAALQLIATAARTNEEARLELASQSERTINATDALANAASSMMGAVKSAVSKRRLAPAVVSSRNAWDTQHSLFAAHRIAGIPVGDDQVTAAAFSGIGSPDPVGARHALGIAADVAYRDAGYVIQQLAQVVHEAADAYEAGVPASSPAAPGQGINLLDPFGRLYLARLCANIVHSDQSSSDVSRDGAPFWRMLVLLATRDDVDMVRFGAMEALSGAVPSGSNAILSTNTSSSTTNKSQNRGDAVLTQRRGRAWRVLVSQAASPISLAGLISEQATTAAPMKLIDVLGRLLVLALRKVESAGRFMVAATVVTSLAESCLASQSQAGTTGRHNTNPDIDRVLNILATEMDTLIESPLPSALRSTCIQAVLYLQASGYRTALTPSKLSQLGGTKKGSGSGIGVQDALLAVVLKCSRAKPKDAASFLGYASGVVGMAPAGLDLVRVTEMWDATAAAGRQGKEAALTAILETLTAPPPPCTRPGSEADSEEVLRAAQQDDGWNAFTATAIWWLGEHINELCQEYVGQKSSLLLSDTATAGTDTTVSSSLQTGEDSPTSPLASTTIITESPEEMIKRQSGRNPALASTIYALQKLALTGQWTLRTEAVRALAKIAIRSGEPYRLQCYSALAMCSNIGGLEDALGLQAITGPVLALLDRIYASQIALNKLWEQHGDDVEGWPVEIVESLSKRNALLSLEIERLVCSVPKSKYSVLGIKAVKVLATAAGEESTYASFLGSEDAHKTSTDARGGGDISTAKNKEVEDILSFGGSESESAFKFTPSDVTGTLGDKNKEIESMLSTSPSAAISNPWTFDTNNAFESTTSGGGSDVYKPYQDDWASTVTMQQNTTYSTVEEPDTNGGQDTNTAASIWGAATTTTNPTYVEQQQQQEQQGTAKVVGIGSMLHTFIADPQNPEEISIFGGDKVQVLEEADGWMLVRDPTGNQGLVPTAYVQLEQLYQSTAAGGASNSGATSPGGYGDTATRAISPTGSASGSAQHKRFASIDYFSNKEDYLDKMFEAGPGSGTVSPTTSAFRTSAGAVRATSPTGPLGRQLSGGASWKATGSPRATSPSRFGPGGSTSDLFRQVSLTAANSGGNPFTTSTTGSAHHQRGLSNASSHHRTLSGGSGGEMSGLGSLPGTPSSIDGPEKTVVAGFVAEMEGELTVEPGDRVKVHSETGGWCRVIRLRDSKIGLVPAWAVQI